MKAVPEHGIKEGWWGGNSRQNSCIYDRVENKKDANKLDDFNAVLFYAEFKSRGWPCKIVPKVDKDRMLEILVNNSY